MSEVGEVEPCEVASELVGGLVVRQGGFLGGVKGSQPEPCTVLGESDLGNPLTPVPLPHTSVKLRGLRRGAHVLHRDGLEAEEAEGVVLLVLPWLGLELDLGLDLVDLGCG